MQLTRAPPWGHAWAITGGPSRQDLRYAQKPTRVYVSLFLLIIAGPIYYGPPYIDPCVQDREYKIYLSWNIMIMNCGKMIFVAEV